MDQKINFSLNNIDKILLEVMQSAKPPENISVSAYTEKYRKLDSVSSNYAGNWKNIITPWLVEPMDVMGPNDPTVHIVLKFGSQMGKTEGIINAIMHRMDIAPCPISMYLPSEKQAKGCDDNYEGRILSFELAARVKKDLQRKAFELNSTHGLLAYCGELQSVMTGNRTCRCKRHNGGPCNHLRQVIFNAFHWSIQSAGHHFPLVQMKKSHLEERLQRAINRDPCSIFKNN